MGQEKQPFFIGTFVITLFIHLIFSVKFVDKHGLVLLSECLFLHTYMNTCMSFFIASCLKPNYEADVDVCCTR